MKFLIIDTSTERSLVAFTQGFDLLLKSLLPPGYQSSRYLMSEIELGFRQLNFSPSELKAIAVTTGPGSYTGIRVGAAVAKGLAFPNSLPLINLCSLSGFISEKQGRFASMIDARIGGAYVMIQERTGGEITSLTSPQFVSKENLEMHLSGCQEIISPPTHSPDPHHLARLAFQKFEQGKYSTDLQLSYLASPYKKY